MKKKIIIAVDGYSSCGKSTISRQLSEKLGYMHIDTGAMYRAVTLYFHENNIDTNNERSVQEALEKISIDFRPGRNRENREVYLNGENAEEAIRSRKVTSGVSRVSALGKVREKLVAMQQRLGLEKGVILDGRDIGTVVFPDADLKIFLTADPEVRAQRRYDELISRGQNTTIEEVSDSLKERDHLDETRKISPLTRAKDAVIIDNTTLTPEEQLNLVYNLARTAECRDERSKSDGS